MVITVIVIGLMIVGSPISERERRFDAQRVGHLRDISSAVDLYYKRTGKLPSSLNDLLKPEIARLYYINSIKDPESSKTYEYVVTGKSTYRLCAVFTQASKNWDQKNKSYAPRYSYDDDRAWEHPVGKKCFDLLLQPDKKEKQN
jgi:hypothetical protein